MKKNKSFLIASLLIIISFNAEANVFDELILAIKNLFGDGGFNQTISQNLTPPAPVCDATSGFYNSPPPPPITPDSTGPEIKEETKSEMSTREKLLANYKKLGGDPTAFNQALCFFDKNKSENFKAKGDPSRSGGIKIDNQRYITINDMNKSYFDSRMFVLDLETGEVKSYFSSHGGGGKKGVAESEANVNETSNKDGSNASPRGFFITGVRVNTSSDQRWKFSMKLHGLQEGINDASYSRAVIMHPFPDVNNGVASSNDEKPILREDPRPFYLSKGCTMIGPEVASPLIDELKAPSSKEGGSLYYNYSATEKSYGNDYCGDENLMKK